MIGELQNCPTCREIKCKCPKYIGHMSEKKCKCGAWNEDVCICKNSYTISNPITEDYPQPTVKVQKASVNLPEDRCKQCELEGNNGVCDRKDCKNFPVPNGVQETNNTNAIKDSVERYAKNLPWNAPVAEAIVFGVQEPWEERLLYEVMEDYILTAELGHLAKDDVLHKKEMREHYKQLLAFIEALLQEERGEMQKDLDKADYLLSHVYLNWGRATDLDVKEDFAKGFNIIAELTGRRKIKATKEGWLPY